MEVTSHNLAAMSQPGAFNYDLGLMQHRTAPKGTMQVLRHMLELAPTDTVRVGNESRFSKYGICTCGDVVLVRVPGATACQAGKVVLHAEVNGVPVTMVTFWRFLANDDEKCISKWDQSHESHELVLTEDIIDTVCYTKLSQNVIGLILPLELR